jgi:hypothetical protein
LVRKHDNDNGPLPQLPSDAEAAERERQLEQLKENQRILDEERPEVDRIQAEYEKSRGDNDYAAGQALRKQARKEERKQQQKERDHELLRAVLKKSVRQQAGIQAKKKQRPDRNAKRDRLIHDGRDLSPEEFGKYARRVDISPLKPKEGDPPWPGWPIAVTRPPYNRKVSQLRYRTKKKFEPKGR